MKYGQVAHFLVYHLLPILVGYGALLALVGALLYFYKRKKGRSDQVEKRPETIEMPAATKSRKKRRKNR